MISGVKNYRHSLIGVSVAIWITIAAGVFLIFISSSKQLGLVSGMVFILVGLYPFVRACMRREFDAFEIINMFVLYMIVHIGIQGLIGIKYDSKFLFYDPDSDHLDILKLKTFSYSTLALLFLYLGYYSRFGNRWLKVLPWLNFDWGKGKVVICFFIYFVISQMAIAIFTTKFGSLGEAKFGTNPAKIIDNVIQSGTTEHIRVFFHFFWTIFYVSCIYKFVKKKSIWGHITVIFCFSEAFIMFLLFGGKSPVLFAIGTYIIARHYLKKPISLKMYVLLFIGIFFLYPFLIFIQINGIYSNWSDLVNYYNSALKNPTELLLPFLGREAGFTPFALFIDSIDSGRSLELGRPMTFLFYFFIPRVLWEGKPLPFSLTFDEEYAGRSVAGANAPSLPGELYVNFHLVGVVLGFLLLGILMKLCYQCLIKRNHNKSSLLIYLPMVLFTPNILEAGTMVITLYLVALLPIMFFLWFVKSKGQGI
ncbi:MAG TPA: O-antigen polymerase [Candidatus Brocadiia bacterium]|nr:O-antigen polymerase [Candidatus Brocadiales bacterium]